MMQRWPRQQILKKKKNLLYFINIPLINKGKIMKHELKPGDMKLEWAYLVLISRVSPLVVHFISIKF